MIVDTSVQRLRCWASVQQMHEAGTQWLEIWAILDGRTSAICREMHGRIISVGQAAAAVDWLASLEPGAFAVQLRNRPAEDDLVAEIRRRGTEALGSAHLLPPYHPRCRTRVKRAAGPPPSPGLPPEGLNAEQERAWSYWQGLPEKARAGRLADAARAEFRPGKESRHARRHREVGDYDQAIRELLSAPQRVLVRMEANGAYQLGLMGGDENHWKFGVIDLNYRIGAADRPPCARSTDPPKNASGLNQRAQLLGPQRRLGGGGAMRELS